MAIEAAWRSLGNDCVAKPLFGSRGRGIVRISDHESLAALLQTTTASQPSGGVAYLQEFVPHDGWDVRILIVGNDAVSMRRFAAPGEWRTNVSLGGRPEAFEPPQAWIDLARAAARAGLTAARGRQAGTLRLARHAERPLRPRRRALIGRSHATSSQAWTILFASSLSSGLSISIGSGLDAS
jgi:hypothetical protein